MTSSFRSVGVVLPNDNRQRVANSTQTPYRWIGQLFSTWPNDGTSVGTAVLLDDLHLLTCAHNVLDRTNNAQARQVVFTPGRNRDHNHNVVSPYPSRSVARFRAPAQYLEAGGPPPPPGGIQFAEITHYLFDFAVCRLASPVTDPPGQSMFTVAPVDPNSFPIAGGRIAGYSGDLDKAGNTMYHRTGTVNLDQDEDYVSYRMSTYDGDSGAPVFYQPPGRPYWQILGVHVAGVAPNATFDGVNFGLAINDANYRLIQQMIDEVDGVGAIRW